MKKMTAILLTLLMLLFVACAGKTESKNTSSTQSTAVPETSSEPPREVEFKDAVFEKAFREKYKIKGPIYEYQILLLRGIGAPQTGADRHFGYRAFQKSQKS